MLQRRDGRLRGIIHVHERRDAVRAARQEDALRAKELDERPQRRHIGSVDAAVTQRDRLDLFRRARSSELILQRTERQRRFAKSAASAKASASLDEATKSRSRAVRYRRERGLFVAGPIEIDAARPR